MFVPITPGARAQTLNRSNQPFAPANGFEGAAPSLFLCSWSDRASPSEAGDGAFDLDWTHTASSFNRELLGEIHSPCSGPRPIPERLNHQFPEWECRRKNQRLALDSILLRPIMKIKPPPQLGRGHHKEHS